MATGLQISVRKKLLARLKTDANLTALVPSVSIYSQRVPANPGWPFVMLGPPTTIGLRATCVRGGTVSLGVHAFANHRVSGGDVVETAEDHAGRIGAAIEAAIDGAMLAMTGGTIKVRLSDMRLLVDGGESDAFHYVCNANCRVLA